MCGLTTSTAVHGCCRVKPSIGHVFFTGLTRSNHKEKSHASPKKSASKCAPDHVCLWSVCTPYWTLRPVFGTPVGYVCDSTPLAGVCGCSRHIVSLWHMFSTGHTFSSHKAALFRAETEILTGPPLKVCVFGSSAASNAQSTLVFGFPQSVRLSSHSSRLCLANGPCSEEFWHDHTYHGDPK